MERSINAELRAALKNEKRLSVAIAGGVTGQSLRVLINSATIRGESNNAAPSGISDKPPRAVPLTARELQILRLIAKGLHNRQIAAKIHRSIKTVEKHRQNLHAKLSTHEVAGLTRQAMVMGFLRKPTQSHGSLSKKAKQLTARELEVLKLVAQGSGNKWIASELCRSIKTIDHHRENIMKKLGIHEVAGLTLHALSIGLL